MKAKSILKDKFWIVEQNGKNIGTIKKDSKYVVTILGEVNSFETSEEITNRFGKQFFQEDVEDVLEKIEKTANGYPTSVEPFNIKEIRTLTTFTKSKTSTTPYCAGYFVIKFNQGWVPSFCPKLSTVEENEYRGPFKNEIESRQVYNRVKS